LVVEEVHPLSNEIVNVAANGALALVVQIDLGEVLDASDCQLHVGKKIDVVEPRKALVINEDAQ